MRTTKLPPEEVSREGDSFEETLQEPFASNPFRLLKLGSGATPADIQAALTKARIDAQLSSSLNPEIELDLVRRAQTELLDAKARVRHAASWFYSPPAFLFDGRFEAGFNGSLLPDTLIPPGGRSQSKDVANWYLALAIHSRISSRVRVFVETAVQRWAAIPDEGDESGTSPSIRIPEHLLNALSTTSTRWIASGRADLTVACIEALQDCGLSADQVLRVVENALGRQVQVARSSMQNAELNGVDDLEVAEGVVNSATPLFELLAALDDAPSQYQEALDDVCMFLRAMSVRLHNEKSQTRTAIEIVESVLDIALGAVKDRLEEDLSELKKQLEQIREYEKFTSLKVKPIRSAPALFTIWGWGLQLYGESEHDSFSNSYAANHYFTAFWIPVFPIARYRVRSAGDKRYLFLGKVPFRTSEKWHLVIGLVVTAIALAWAAVAAAANDNSTGSNGSYAPSRSNPSRNLPITNPTIAITAPTFVVPTVYVPPLVVPTTVPVIRPTATPDTRAAERARLSAAIEANKARISQLGAQVDQLDATLSNLDSQMSSLKSQMDSIARTYAVNNSLPEPQYTQYERLRSQFNSLVNQYNSTLAQRNTLAKQHDDLLDETNGLIDQYNSTR